LLLNVPVIAGHRILSLVCLPIPLPGLMK